MINDQKDLQKLFKLCRAQGVTEFEMNGIKIKFGDLPVSNSQTVNNTIEESDRYARFPEGELTPEQLMFYSAGGDPKDDPVLNRKEITA